MSNEASQPIEVRCTDCRFAQVVGPDDEELPAEIIVDHGEETGHTLTTGAPEN